MTAPAAIDDEICRSLALVIDSNEVSRRTLVGMLRDFGVRRIEQASRPQDAREMLELRPYDIVLCDYHFAGAPINGQELMDDLRQSGLLSLNAVVVMISGERTYGHVAEAAEVALDAYLLKPHTADALRIRLAQARERKRLLSDLLAMVNSKRFDEAVAVAEKLLNERGQAWIQAARIGADLYLRLGRPQDSSRLLDEVLKTGAVPWARLGLARAQTESGAVFKARRTLESLISDLPGYTDAYDVLGRVLLEQGDAAGAIAALRRASELTPNSVHRLNKLGLMAFYFGDADEALTSLGRAVRLGLGAKTFDLQGLALLAASQYDHGDEPGLSQTVTQMAKMRQAALESPRLRRFEATVQALLAMVRHLPGEAMPLLNGLLADVRSPDFDFEAATNLLMVLARLDSDELRLPDLPHHVDALSMRFAVSRTTCELMCAALKSHGPMVARIQAAYQKVCADTERAVERTLAGEPGEAAATLLKLAEQTLNAKLMDLAFHTVQRHYEKIANPDELAAQVRKLQEVYRNGATPVKGGAVAGTAVPGGPGVGGAATVPR